MRRAKAGRLHRVHRGVYAVGHANLSHVGRCRAATLACGPKAVVSHRSAAALWGLVTPRPGPIEVSVSGTGGREKRSGIRIHRSRTLVPNHTAKRLGIPVTTPARTVDDLRNASIGRRKGAISQKELRQAIRQAGVLGLRIDSPLEADRTRSELEDLFLRLCRRHRLPMPEVNVPIDKFLVDFLWRDRQLIVETDGYRYHGDRAAFEEDRERDLSLKVLGYEVIRLSYRQVAKEPTRVVESLTALLD